MSITERAREREREIEEQAKKLAEECGETIRRVSWMIGRAYAQGYTDGKADQWEQSRFKEEGE